MRWGNESSGFFGEVEGVLRYDIERCLSSSNGGGRGRERYVLVSVWMIYWVSFVSFSTRLERWFIALAFLVLDSLRGLIECALRSEDVQKYESFYPNIFYLVICDDT